LVNQSGDRFLTLELETTFSRRARAFIVTVHRSPAPRPACPFGSRTKSRRIRFYAFTEGISSPLPMLRPAIQSPLTESDPRRVLQYLHRRVTDANLDGVINAATSADFRQSRSRTHCDDSSTTSVVTGTTAASRGSYFLLRTARRGDEADLLPAGSKYSQGKPRGIRSNHAHRDFAESGSACVRVLACVRRRLRSFAGREAACETQALPDSIRSPAKPRNVGLSIHCE